MIQLEELKKILHKERCGIYVGAGLSMAAGLPSWKKLLNNLIDEAKHCAYISKEKENEYKQLLQDPTKYLLLASELKEILAIDFRTYMRKTFATDCPAPTKLHELIMNLPFRFCLTTNYDTLLEDSFTTNKKKRAIVYTYAEANSAAGALWDRSYFIMKLHGDAQRTPENLILSEKDYRQIIFKELGYKSFLQSLFTSYSILFTGVSLQDPDLKLVLGYLHDSFHGGGPKHYALISKDSISDTEISRWRKDFNVQVVPYDSKNKHEELGVILNDLKIV